MCEINQIKMYSSFDIFCQERVKHEVFSFGYCYIYGIRGCALLRQYICAICTLWFQDWIYQHIFSFDHLLTHRHEAKWLLLSRRHFQMHFREWKYMNFDYDFTEVCSQRSNWQYSSMGSDNGLAPSRRQAIIWTNDDLFTDACIYIYIYIYMRHSVTVSYGDCAIDRM